MSRSAWSVRRGAPLLGEHSAEVYGDLLGRGMGEIAVLAEEAAI